MTVSLLRRGRLLETATLAWNVVGVVVLGLAAVRASSTALAGFGLDTLVEIGASAVVLWELAGVGADRRRRALGLIAVAFALLAAYLLVQSLVALAAAHHPSRSALGTVWTAATAVVMAALAAGKRHTGLQLGNEVLVTEGRVTAVDALLAAAVLVGVVLDAAAGLWWADPLSGLVVVVYAAREGAAIRADLRRPRAPQPGG